MEKIERRIITIEEGRQIREVVEGKYEINTTYEDNIEINEITKYKHCSLLEHDKEIKVKDDNGNVISSTCYFKDGSTLTHIMDYDEENRCVQRKNLYNDEIQFLTNIKYGKDFKKSVSIHYNIENPRKGSGIRITKSEVKYDKKGLMISKELECWYEYDNGSISNKTSNITYYIYNNDNKLIKEIVIKNNRVYSIIEREYHNTSEGFDDVYSRRTYRIDQHNTLQLKDQTLRYYKNEKVVKTVYIQGNRETITNIIYEDNNIIYEKTSITK